MIPPHPSISPLTGICLDRPFPPVSLSARIVNLWRWIRARACAGGAANPVSNAYEIREEEHPR
jgi:hypothetical protein